MCIVFFFKQKTAYEMRISDWSSDVCSSDLDIARLHLCADIDDARLVQVPERFLAHVRDVAGDIFRPELGVAGHHLELLDVDRGEDVVLHDPLGDQDGRSDERRGGTEWASPCNSRWSPYPQTTQNNHHLTPPPAHHT